MQKYTLPVKNMSCFHERKILSYESWVRYYSNIKQTKGNSAKRNAEELSFSERPRKIVRLEVDKYVNILNTLTETWFTEVAM